MHISKYNASGNDFVIFHTFAKADRSALARELCNRFDGVGADGLIVLLPNAQNDFEWEFYNSDGSMAAMCGNGSRAAAFYAYLNGLSGANLSFLSGAGVIKASVEKVDLERLNSDFTHKNLDVNSSAIYGVNSCLNSMFKTNLESGKFAMVEVALTRPKKLSETFSEFGFTWHFYNTGVPHLVSFVKDLNEFNLDLCAKMRTKYDTNVNFAQIIDGKIKVRTFERGVENETNACGTGMAACFFAARESGEFGDKAVLNPKSGEDLFLRFSGETIFFKGLVKRCFEADL